MNARREPGIGPAIPTATKPPNVTVTTPRRGGSFTVFWLATLAFLAANAAIMARIGPALLDLWLGQGDGPDMAALAIWLLALIAANLGFGILALLARPR